LLLCIQRVLLIPLPLCYFLPSPPHLTLPCPSAPSALPSPPARPPAGLLCINQAKEGGFSSFASTLAVHNELLRRKRKDLVECLAGPGWYRDRSRYQDLPEGANPLWQMPVFT
jgi:hypothetical protein